ncbi:glycosyl hydrolases family 18 domain-containing protein [Hirsutella rhossiliensis]|uniref:chitinase n=1 Tax=Hirsutella rhossiliensis TaxID=111463 RepID=A0A9P8SMC0_9HYPO|nr:glycosyl hydrolases family 18 domain-containing protein [Hirsutella rhossiliensis]KAH0967846.1 glycosyl hydrolases family 18 domain-containing protein [Hirsutella rhossiliensis]
MHFNRVSTLAGLGLAMLGSALSKPLIFGYMQFSDKANLELDFSKYTHINLAFAIPKPDGSLAFDGNATLPQAVDKIHEKGAKAQISIGGFLGSANFSNIVKDQALRSTFTENIVNFLKTNKLDGVDVDWEFPGREGDPCNVVDKENDSANFLIFLTELRQRFTTEFGKDNMLITMAVRVQPFDGPDGPMSNVSAFAAQTDYAFLMAYDINGPWAAESGANAPLNFEVGKGAQFSANSSLDNWLLAGWPAEKLVLGVPFYGHGTQLENSTANATSMYQAQSTQAPLGDQEDAVSTDACTGKNASSGAWRWKHLRGQGLLDTATTAKEPWENHQFISYDDPDSLKAKAELANLKGLGGMMIWSIDMDTNDYELTDVIKDNLKVDQCGKGPTS